MSVNYTMGEQKIKVTEYTCERCDYKFIARKNGKDKPKPVHCPRCKTDMWNIPRVKDMSKYYEEKERRELLRQHNMLN